MSETTDLLTRLRNGGMTQVEIARRTGIPQPRLSRWANGEAPDSADDALKIKALVENLDAQAVDAAAAPAIAAPAPEVSGAT